ncbi:MAG TPA: helix-turn-helix domain-containing protein [bacterium]|nr:helix-turn-helix domain-containing protein [bacterium]HPS28738.1 helix-turn-helix domain-containing protein [bacterium]
MDNNYCLPSQECRVLIKKYESIISDTNVNLIDKHIPRGDSSFVFNLRGNVYIIDSNGSATLPEMFIAPNLLRAITLNVRGKILSFIVICKSSVLSRLFGIDLTPESSILYKKVSNEIFLPVWNDLAVIETYSGKIEFFEEFLLRTVLSKKYVPDEIDEIYDYIFENAAVKPLNSILESIPFSERSFRRNFIKRVGVNAKTLARICRVNYLWERAEYQNMVDYGDLVFCGGYFDQAHFIKDFKSIVGETPGHFFKRNREQVKIMSGK